MQVSAASSLAFRPFPPVSAAKTPPLTPPPFSGNETHAASALMSSARPDSVTDITAASLLAAGGKELRYWIAKANENADKKLSKSGKVQELRERLAAHYGLELSAPGQLAPIEGPHTVDEHIQKRQWGYLRALGDEWDSAVRSGRPFRLCEPSGGKLS
jgi:hypothetical protein